MPFYSKFMTEGIEPRPWLWRFTTSAVAASESSFLKLSKTFVLLSNKASSKINIRNVSSHFKSFAAFLAAFFLSQPKTEKNFSFVTFQFDSLAAGAWFVFTKMAKFRWYWLIFVGTRASIFEHGKSLDTYLECFIELIFYYVKMIRRMLKQLISFD